MKVWFGYGSENSTNFVIIGTFKKAGDAQRALDIIKEASLVADAESKAGRLDSTTAAGEMSSALLDFVSRTNMALLRDKDLGDLLFEFHPRVDGDKLVITTEEADVGAFVKAITHFQGRVEIYSAHDYKSKYGRQTHGND